MSLSVDKSGGRPVPADPMRSTVDGWAWRDGLPIPTIRSPPAASSTASGNTTLAKGLAANANNFGAKGAEANASRTARLPGRRLCAEWLEDQTHASNDHALQTPIVARPIASSPDDSRKSIPTTRCCRIFPGGGSPRKRFATAVLSITGELVHSSGGLPIIPRSTWRLPCSRG